MPCSVRTVEIEKLGGAGLYTLGFVDIRLRLCANTSRRGCDPYA